MKKMYKIFGAVAIIGLFLLGSIASTSMAKNQQLTSEEEEEILVPSEPPEEPQGVIPADLFTLTVDRQPITQKIRYTVINQGMGCAWMPYYVHLHVDGILNGDDNMLVWGPVLPGPEFAKSFVSRICLAGHIPRYTTIDLDITNKVFEGLLGEGNNHFGGYV